MHSESVVCLLKGLRTRFKSTNNWKYDISRPTLFSKAGFLSFFDTLSADIKVNLFHLELVAPWPRFCGNRSSCGFDSGEG